MDSAAGETGENRGDSHGYRTPLESTAPWDAFCTCDCTNAAAIVEEDGTVVPIDH